MYVYIYNGKIRIRDLPFVYICICSYVLMQLGLSGAGDVSRRELQ